MNPKKYLRLMKLKSMLFIALLMTPSAALHAAETPDQTYDQLVPKRLREGLDAVSSTPERQWRSNPGAGIWMALLFLTDNKNVAEAEQIIADFCGKPLTEYLGKPVSQSRNEAVFRIYLTDKTRRLLSPKTKATIEDYALELITKYHRNITRADADKSFWLFTSSENFYVNNRRRFVQALQTLRMSDRYGPSFQLQGESIESHYQAWVAFWIRYFRDRAGQGTDMEMAHPGSYGETTVGGYYDIYDQTDSPRLRELAGNFLDLYWAEVATEFDPRTGVRALAATRNPGATRDRTYWAKNLLYCYGWHDAGSKGTSLSLVPFFLSSYRPPEIVRAVARNSDRGAYLSISRRALMIEGEEKESQGIIVFDKNGDGHLRRNVFYTPDYMLSTMTLDPARKYHVGGTLAQAMGVNFSADINSRIVLTGTGYYAERALNGITGTAVSLIARDPKAAFGRGRFMSDGTRVLISNGQLWDNRVEDPSGWFFTRVGDAYAAIRVAGGGYTVTTRTYTWPGRELQEIEEKSGRYLELKDLWAPIVIQMGRAADYSSFVAFQTAIKGNKLEYENGKLTYLSAAKDKYEYWTRGTQSPKINGATVNLNPRKTYDSPFLSMEHGQSKAVIHCPGYKDEVLDFGGPKNQNPAK